MDLNDIWQENKRFITTVGSGFLVFLIGYFVVEGVYAGDIDNINRSNSQARRKLNTEMFTADDREVAQGENDALLKSFETLTAAVAFTPRPEFDLEGRAGSARNVYMSSVDRVRNRVEDLASRRRARWPEGLDLERLETNNVDAIERNLHALDLLERVLVLAVESGVKQVRSADIKLDPAFTARRGLGSIEKTKVEVDIVASPDAVARWLLACETPADGGADNTVRQQALPIDSIDARRATSKSDEVQAKVTFLVVRVNEVEVSDDEDA